MSFSICFCLVVFYFDAECFTPPPLRPPSQSVTSFCVVFVFCILVFAFENCDAECFAPLQRPFAECHNQFTVFLKMYVCIVSLIIIPYLFIMCFTSNQIMCLDFNFKWFFINNTLNQLYFFLHLLHFFFRIMFIWIVCFVFFKFL